MKLKIIQEEFFQSASVVYPSTETSASSTAAPTVESRSSQAVTLASPSVKLGSAKAQRMTAISGRRCYELLSKRDPLGCLLRTWLVTSQWVSTRCWLTWKVKATPHGRLLFQLVPSVPRIEETESGLSQSHWMTPRANDAKNSTYSGKGDLYLCGQVQLWPTPRQSEHKDCGPVGSASHQHMLDRKYLCAATKESDRPTGKLNPLWVEWLMGYPIGWTDLKH